jgi:hypothetical protein
VSPDSFLAVKGIVAEAERELEAPAPATDARGARAVIG